MIHDDIILLLSCMCRPQTTFVCSLRRRGCQQGMIFWDPDQGRIQKSGWGGGGAAIQEFGDVKKLIIKRHVE